MHAAVPACTSRGSGVSGPNVSKDQFVVPTITVVEDTFDKHRDAMAQIIQEAKEWTGMDWKG